MRFVLSFCRLFVFPLMGKAEVVILSADDWVCIFILFIVWMMCPSQGSTGGWVIRGLVFKWFSLWEFSLFDTPQG